MKRLIKSFLHRLPHISSLYEQVKKQGKYPAGHYYSPIPSSEEIFERIESQKLRTGELSDIALNDEDQYKLLEEYSLFYDELPFPEKQSSDCRYYYDQSFFCYADAIFLYSFLRKNRPKRIIEVGSGFSSAVILDTIERFLLQQTKITFIEPYPNRLISLLKEHDKHDVRLINKRAQQVPIETMASLGPGDLLFIDSSHVVKCGSDLQFLLFDVLPQLPPGVFVHFHDIFYPFEYPVEWLVEGRYWNELYFLRAFLSGNSKWRIYFFNSYISFTYREFVREKMPLCLKNPGGSLYLQRI